MTRLQLHFYAMIAILMFFYDLWLFTLILPLNAPINKYDCNLAPRWFSLLKRKFLDSTKTDTLF